jgi:hypothetical protein
MNHPSRLSSPKDNADSLTCGSGGILCRMEELVLLVYDTIREKAATFPLPAAIAKAMLAPREAIRRSVRLSRIPVDVHVVMK